MFKGCTHLFPEEDQPRDGNAAVNYSCPNTVNKADLF